ncbi:MAG: PrgI family protein [Lachnospiraceae bacterium]|nr:PrgI family protein [Lachnospiraceae bacterium]
MAAYVSVPRDLSRVRTKVFLNLTKRQIICFGTAALFGVPSFFMIKSAVSTTVAAMAMVLIMLPMFFMALYEKDGYPAEILLKHMILSHFIRPKVRPYRTDNYYDAMMREERAAEEVRRIVRESRKRKEKNRVGTRKQGKIL